MPRRNIWRLTRLAERKSATIDPVAEYHLGELEIALDPSRPEHILPNVHAARLGIMEVGCGMGQLFVAKASEIPTGVGRYGFDIDKASIAYALEHWREKARFAVAPAGNPPLPNASFGVYVSRVALLCTDIPAALAEAARVLMPGSHLWITLHPVSMTMWELAQAARRARLKEVVRRMVVLWNGLVFHVFGDSQRVLGICDAWQSTALV
jgi:SAM-dependent methyltransferase